MFYCRCISRIILMCLFHSFSWSLLADFTLTFTSWADPIPMKLFQISRSSNNILVKSMWYNLVCEFDFNFGQRIKASEFTNERVFGINIISNLCPYDQCIFQCNHSFDIDEIEVWPFSITNICQDSLTGFLGHLQSNNCKMVKNRFLIWVSRSDIPNQMCDCFWKWMIPIME